MKEINIIVEINNTENPYFYKGIATIDNDVIRYKDDDSHVLVDMSKNLLIKKDKNKMIKLDLNNKVMRIKIGNIELNSELEVSTLKKEDNILDAIYKIDENEIKLRIKIED